MTPAFPLRTLASLLLAAASASAQLGGDLVDVCINPLAPDYCGISLEYVVLTGPNKYVQSGGAACADFDGDGWLDVWMAGNLGQANRLYRNLGDGSFLDVAAAKGLQDTAAATSTALFHDYDHDGDLDYLAITHLGDSGTPFGPIFRLFRNSGPAGDHAFVDVTAGGGFVLAPTVEPTNAGWAGCMAMGDYDGDGWSDLFATWWWDGPSGNMWRLMQSQPNPLRGDPGDPAYSPRVFVDRTIDAGLNIPVFGEPWQPLWLDYDRDGDLDLHANVDFEYDFLFSNDGDGTFTDVALGVGLNGTPPEGRNEMGAAMGDIDNDGDFDFHLTNLFEADRFYRCDSFPGGASYVDVAPQTGLYDSPWGWGDTFFDFDLDGDLDHAAVSGFRFPTALPWWNTFHLNLYPQTLVDGVTTKWQNVATSLPDFTKIFTAFGDNARALAPVDYDHDGDLDLVVTRHEDPNVVYLNTLANGNRWLQVDLVNSGGSLDVANSVAWLKTADRVQMRQVQVGSSFQTQEPSRLHFGLGPAPAQDPTPTLPQPGLRAGGAAGSAAKKPGGPSGPASPGPGPTWSDPAWLVVQWPDRALQIVRNPQPNQILTVQRSGIDDRGDLDGDGHLTAADHAMLLLAATDLAAYKAAYPDAPGLVTGDVDGNGFLQMADHAAWSLLPPH